MPVPMRPPPITTTSFTALVAMPLRMILVRSRSYFAGSPGDDIGQHCWKSSGKSKVPLKVAAQEEIATVLDALQA